MKGRVKIKTRTREEEILALLSERGEVTVEEISRLYSVSRVTVRSDLNSLASRGLVQRTHGGAVKADHTFHGGRRIVNLEKKEALAKRAAAFVEDGDSILISNGTTCTLIGKYLIGKKNIHIVTNNTSLLPFASFAGTMRITLVGGEYRPETESIVGHTAAKQMKEYHVTVAFLGTDGITLEHGLTTSLPENAEILRAMCTRADRTVVVADSTKYGKKGFVRILPPSLIDVLITDSDFPGEARSALERLGVEVITV